MAHFGGAVLRLQFGEGVSHTVQLELAQQVVGWVIERVYPFSVEIVGAANVGVGDRRFLCGTIRGPAIALGLQDGLQGALGMGADHVCVF